MRHYRSFNPGDCNDCSMQAEVIDQWKSVDVAFNKQSTHFDEDDFSNPVLQAWRKRVYKHVDEFIKPNSKILEINAGTGIDAVHFASCGHSLHATDISSGMIARIREKIDRFSLSDKISVQQVSFENLDQVDGKFDYVFSNFGGLNCADDLTKVTRHLPQLLNEGAFVTWVIMPRVAPWEWTWMFKGKFKDALRRFEKNGVAASVEDEFFLTYYHPLRAIEKSFGLQFQLVKSEGLGVLSPPPSATNFVKSFPRTSNFLNQVDKVISKWFPFNRWGDHLIVTMRFVR